MLSEWDMLIATCRVTRVHTSEHNRVTITLVYAMPCNHGDNINLKKDIIAELRHLEHWHSITITFWAWCIVRRIIAIVKRREGKGTQGNSSYQTLLYSYFSENRFATKKVTTTADGQDVVLKHACMHAFWLYSKTAMHLALSAVSSLIEGNPLLHKWVLQHVESAHRHNSRGPNRGPSAFRHGQLNITW